MSAQDVHVDRWFHVPDEVKRKAQRPWSANEVLYNVLLLVVACMVIVTAIYWPVINGDAGCGSWCCRYGESSSDDTNRASHREATARLPFQPQESKASLTQFSREQNGAVSGANSAVMVVEAMFTGLAVLSIPHKPLYSISRLAAEAQSSDNDTTFTFQHKHQFPMVTVSGKRGSAEELFMTVYMAQTLARPGAVLILNGLTDEHSAAFAALLQLVQAGVLAWQPTDLYRHGTETWASARFQAVNPSKAVSEYLFEMMARFLELSGTPVRYYVISKEREDELRRAYKHDTLFTVHNVTTACHGAVLKVLFPALRLEVRPPPPLPSPLSVTTPTASPTAEDLIYPRALEFLQKYIL